MWVSPFLRVSLLCWGLAQCAASAPAQGRDKNKYAYEAQALALAFSLGERNSPSKPSGELCPCSVKGTCPCSRTSDCGCHRDYDVEGRPVLYRWIATDKRNQTALYYGTQQVGNYWHDEAEYRRMVASWGDAVTWVVDDCPVAAPVREVYPPVPFQRGAPTFLPPAVQTQGFTPVRLMTTPRAHSFPQRSTFRGGFGDCSSGH
jgi:hypothetical protein